MNAEIVELVKTIQTLRAELKELVASKDAVLNDEEVVRASQRLDEVLMEYEGLILRLKGME